METSASHQNTRSDSSYLKSPNLRTAAIAQSFLAAAGLNAQSSNEVENSKPVDLDPITVKGEKLSLYSPKFTAPLRDTPRTINVIPDTVLQQQQATSLRDALRNSPGITFQAGEGGTNAGDNLFIRGFSAEGDIFVDGVRDNSQYSRDVFNLEQVEVSKGPSSATTGRGSTGGSVNLVTKKPFVGQQTNGTLALGSNDYIRATIDTNQTLNEQTGSAVRINAMYSDFEVPGRDGVTKSSWAFNPTYGRKIGENTRITLGYQHLEQDNVPDNGLWRDATTDPDYDWSNFYGLFARDYEKVEDDIFSAEIASNLNNGLTLRNYTQYNDSSVDLAVTSPRVATVDDETLTTYRDLKQKDRAFDTFSNDLNLRGQIGSDSVRHNFSVGLEYTIEGYQNFARFHEGTAPTAPLYEPDPYLTYDYEIGRTGAYTDTKADTMSLYAFDTLSLHDTWEINAGIRWDNFDAEQKNYDENGTLSDTLSRKDDMFNYSAGIVYKPRENGSIYFGYGTSFSPSAEDLALSESSRGRPAANHPDLEPEETRNYELGSKWDFADGRLALTGAFFRTEKTNARTRTSNTDLYVLEGKQTIDGIELGISGLITDSWTVYSGVSFMESSIDQSLDPAEEGHELPYAPSTSFNFWTSYQATDRLQLGAGAQYTGDYYYSATADESSIPPQADYWVFDLMASYYLNEAINLRLNVKNATDEQYIERGYSAHFTPGAARSVTLAADYRF